MSRIYRQGSVTVIVSLSETNIPTSGMIQLALDIHTPPGTEVFLPEIADFVKPFSVADGYAEPVQTMPNGKELQRRVWMLIPSLPGDTVFGSVDIHAGEITVSTEPIEVQVTSVLPDNLDLFEIKDIAEPIALLPEEKKKQQRWFVLLVAGIVLVLGTLGIKRFSRPKIPPMVSPDDAARQALSHLPEEELARTQALTEILLAYIEGRFHLPTSGKTIPEILPYLRKEPLLDRQQELEPLLVTGEQFRFSNKLPAGLSIELENHIRAFIEETKEAPCD
ncbi:MAG: hypothetical protein HKP10_06435 [Kiritimatiellales bacterium]|nr:hypothetical protein [Kiritimatiellales bacterium]